MAVIERCYRQVTHEQLDKCLRWGLNYLNLRDWEVVLNTKALFNGDVGTCEFRGYGYLMKAIISIDLEKHKRDDSNPYSTVLHEVLHLLTNGVCQIDVDKSEPVCYRLEDALYRLYCQDKNITLSKGKD